MKILSVFLKSNTIQKIIRFNFLRSHIYHLLVVAKIFISLLHFSLKLKCTYYNIKVSNALVLEKKNLLFMLKKDTHCHAIIYSSQK